METEYEKAYTALDMFCRAAEKATGDCWGIQQMENGDLAVVQRVNAEFPGTVFCMSSGGLVDLAKRLVLTFSRGPDDCWVPSLPLPFLSGCASAEEMTVRLAACC